MGAFSRWYISMLKNRPMTTNVCSAVVLMATGDVMAQELEHNNVGDRFAGKGQETDIPLDKRLSLKRYGTVNPDVAQMEAKRAFDDKTKHPPKQQNEKDQTSDHQDDNPLQDFQEAISYAVTTVQAECEFLDVYRTLTMMGWSAFFYTPLYVSLYRVCDRYMPHQTPTTVGARVLLSFLLSVPINTAFFTYGTFVHHTMEWMAIQREWRYELEDMGISHAMMEEVYGNVVPYDWEMLQATARLKLESELVTTVLDSAKVWIPLNFLNFTVVAPHLRPMVLLTFSIFWNAYLSLAQHRDLSIPNGNDDDNP